MKTNYWWAGFGILLSGGVKISQVGITFSID